MEAAVPTPRNLTDFLATYPNSETRRSYYYDLRSFLRWLRGRTGGLAAGAVDEWHDHLARRRVGASAVDRSVSAARQFILWLAGRGLVDPTVVPPRARRRRTNAAGRGLVDPTVVPPRARRRRTNAAFTGVIADETVVRRAIEVLLVDGSRGRIRTAAYLALAIETGMRGKQLRALTWGDLDDASVSMPDGSRLTLSERALTAIGLHEAVYYGGVLQSRIFPVTRAAIHRWLDHAAGLVGVPIVDLSPRAVRHAAMRRAALDGFQALDDALLATDTRADHLHQYHAFLTAPRTTPKEKTS